MSFAVIIPSRNAGNLARCVASVRQSEPEAEIRVMWDRSKGNGFIPPTADYMVRDCDSEFIFSRNVNIGIEAALEVERIETTKIGDGYRTFRPGRINDGIVILGDDGLLETPGGFSLLAEECHKDPTIGVIGCTTNLGHRCQKPQGVGLRFVDHFAFVAVYIPRTTIEKVGLLDERFGGQDSQGRTIYGYEDEDYNHRVKLAGLKVAVHDGCYVDHGSLRSTFRGDPKSPASLAPGRDVFKEKWPGVHGY